MHILTPSILKCRNVHLHATQTEIHNTRIAKKNSQSRRFININVNMDYNNCTAKKAAKQIIKTATRFNYQCSFLYSHVRRTCYQKRRESVKQFMILAEAEWLLTGTRLTLHFTFTYTFRYQDKYFYCQFSLSDNYQHNIIAF